MAKSLPHILHEISCIETMQPVQGAIHLAFAFMRVERLLFDLIQASQDGEPYGRCWQVLNQYGGAELKAMLFYYHESAAHRLHIAKYVESFRRLQYLVSQTVTLLP